MNRLALIFIAGLMALATACAVGIYVLNRPNTLRIAVGPPDSDDWRVFKSMERVLERQREDVRFKIRPVTGPRAAAEALERHEVDLAVVRSDLRLPVNGHSVAIIQRQAGVLMAPASQSIASVADLSGHTVAVIRPGEANVRLLDTILAQNDIAPHNVARVTMNANQLAEALSGGKVEAVFVVAATTDTVFGDVIAALTSAGGGAPHFIPVSDAEAIVQRDPTLESVEVVRGTFGGASPRPAEDFTTIGTTHRLVADVRLDDNAVGEVTRVLFSARPIVSREVPSANRIQALESGRAMALPVHSGTVAYLENDELTFFDRYGDFFYIGAMLASFVGSVIAAGASRLTARRRQRATALTAHLIELMQKARLARSLQDLKTIERDADALLIEAMNESAAGTMERGQLAAFTLALDQARGAVATQRAQLQSA